MSFLTTLFGDPSKKELKKIQPIVEEIDALEPDFEKLSDEALKAKTQEFRDRLQKGETLDDILPEAFATVREASKRTTGMRHFDVQILAGIVGHQGRIFEQKTGEAVKVALMTGAIAGNAPAEDIEHLSKFSEWFGIAYQIRDDLNEFRGESERKHPFDFPFLLALLNQSMNGESPKFAEMLQKNNFGILIDYLKKYRAVETADRYLQQYIAKCYAELDLLKNMKLRLSLYGIMGKVFKR